MRRVALLSDVHANLVALEAVLDDIAACGVEELYCLGDLVGYGPDPAGVVERIRRAGIPTIQGNYDEGIGNRRGACGCYYATEKAEADGAASIAFTERALDDADHQWLASLPPQIRFGHAGARVLLAHGSPRRNNEYLLPDRSDEQLARLADDAEADVVCIGHIHVPYHRALTAGDGRTVHYVSSGSVGKPKDGDARAGWVELMMGSREPVVESCADESAAAVAATDLWLGVVSHRVDYDIERVAAAIVAVGLPDTLADALRSA